MDQIMDNHLAELRDRLYENIDRLEKRGDPEGFIPCFERQIERVEVQIARRKNQS